MAFSSTNLQLVAQPYSNGPKTWLHSSTDAHATIEAAGFFADGKRLGLTTGDLLLNLAVSTDGSSAVTAHIVSASTAAVSAASPLPSSAFGQAFNVTVSAAST